MPKFHPHKKSSPALEYGYYDISGFNRRFKAYTGMTPQPYKFSDEPDPGRPM